MRRFAAVAALALVAVGGGDVARGDAAVAGKTSFAVYLVRAERVAPVRRSAATRAPVRAAVAALLRGPTQAEARGGYSTALPAGTALRGLSVAGGVATVDLSRRFESGGGSLSMQLRVAQLVHTLTRFAPVRRVAFRLDGKPAEAIGGEGVVVSPPVGRAAFEAVAPPILVERPLPGDRVGRTVLVGGTANVFEARLVVELVGRDGSVLARRNVSASAGTGTRGTFAARLAPTRGAVAVVAYAHSPKDGSRIDAVRVPVRVP